MNIKSTILKSLLVLTVFGFSGASAVTIPGKSECAIQTEQTIRSSLKLISIVPAEEKIEVLFSTGINGSINFVLVKTNDAVLKKEIEKQFYSLNFPLLQRETINSVTIRFKKI